MWSCNTPEQCGMDQSYKEDITIDRILNDLTSSQS